MVNGNENHFSENHCFSSSKDGIINCDPFETNRSQMLKPLSAIKLSPYIL